MVLAHRGNIGGGRPGIGKGLFVASFRGRWLYGHEGNRRKKVAFVGALGALGSLDFGPQLRDFVLEVDRIKRLASPGWMPPQ